MRGAALLQLQSLATGVREDYATLKAALHEKFVPKERVELHKAEFRARHRERDEPDLASSLRRLVSRAYPEAVPDFQDSLAKDQFIDALEDREMRMKLRESGPKTLDEAVSRALQIEATYEAESRCGKGRSVRVVQESSKGETSELVEILKQNTAAMNQTVNFVQQQQHNKSRQASQSETVRDWDRTRVARGIFVFGSVSSAIKKVILWQIVNKRWRRRRETSRDRGCGLSIGRETREDPKV